MEEKKQQYSPRIISIRFSTDLDPAAPEGRNSRWLPHKTRILLNAVSYPKPFTSPPLRLFPMDLLKSTISFPNGLRHNSDFICSVDCTVALYDLVCQQM